MAKGYCSLELYDNIETGKNSYVTSGTCSSYTDYTIPFQIEVDYKSFGPYSYADYLAAGMGQSYLNIPSGQRLLDPTIFSYFETGTKSSYNNDWTDSVWSGRIANYISSLSGKDAAIINRVVDAGTFKYFIYPENFASLTGKVNFNLFQISGGNYPYSNYKSELAAWASYRLSPSGTTAYNTGIQRGVVSWAIEVANDITITNGGIFSTGADFKDSSIFYTGVDIRESYLQYCLLTESLNCEGKEVSDKNICYTGSLTGTGYNIFLNNLLNQFASNISTSYDNNSVNGLNYLESSTIEQLFGFWSGHIEYNDFLSGDRLYFDLYPFNYVQEYGKIFYSNPPIPSTGFYLQYPEDFSSVDELVNKLNNKLFSGLSELVSYPVWYNYDCIGGSGNTGVYVTGSLLKAEKINDNLISFYSLRNIKSGYSLYFDLIDRENQENYPIQNTGLNYLLPSYISLQGSYDENSWFNLDEKSGIDWLNIEPITITLTGDLPESGINTIPNLLEEPEEYIELYNNATGEYIQLFSFTQSGFEKIGDKCPVQPFSREIKVVYPSGFASGVNPCKNGEEGEEEPEEEPSITGQSGEIIPIYDYNILRTGWNITNPQNSTLATFPFYDYNYYRVYISGFETQNSGYFINSNRFIINNINLFYGETGTLSALTGAPECVIGSRYTLDIQGEVPVIITGNITGIMNQSDSGIVCFQNALVSAKIKDKEIGDLVKFNKQSGRLIVESGTGVINDCITGTGCFETGITDWFYDTGTNIISFESGYNLCIEGSGRFSGEYIRLKPSFVNEQLALGGFLQGIFDVTITTGVEFTGLAYVDLVDYNLMGIYNYTGITGGYAALGYYEINTGISTILNSETVDYVAGGATGYTNSEAILYYGNPQEFDWVSINGVSISYNSDTENWTAPNYYSNSGQLIQIINENPSVFLSSGFVEDGNIKFKSLISGKDGNDIEVLWGRGNNTGNQTPYFLQSTFTGGSNLYRQISGTGFYSGNLSLVIFNTGYYINSNLTGVITGFIPTFQGERTFTGVWGLSTGNFFTGYNNFLNEGFLNGDSYYHSIGGPDYALTPQNIDIGLLYNDLFDIRGNNDIVKLIFSGSGVSGITKLITGVYPII